MSKHSGPTAEQQARPPPAGNAEVGEYGGNLSPRDWPVALPSGRPLGNVRAYRALRNHLVKAGLETLHIETCGRLKGPWQEAKAKGLAAPADH